jgi:predicted HicB family RNase H-like nuclease
MISDDCDIEEFFQKIIGRRELEAIHMAHQEATMAERQILCRKFLEGTGDPSMPSCSEYSKTLKEFIRYVRYSANRRLPMKQNIAYFVPV